MKYALLLLVALASFDSVLAQEVESLDTTVNSSINEMNPIIHPNGKRVYFTRANHQGNMGGKKDKGDVWVSELGQNGWSKAVNVGQPINNADFNAVIGFSNDGETMFLNNVYSRNNTSVAQGVSVSHKQGNSWSFPEPVPLKYFHNKSDHQSISLSQDGRVMLMAKESFVTYGAEDIYVSFQRSNGEWTDPLNIGPDINTKFQEVTPTLLKDNKTLIFASNGHGGEGSFDLFYSERLDDTWLKWSKPQNLGSTINTKGREMYYSLSPDEEYAYFVSTQNSEGYGDIKRIKIKPEDLAKKVEKVEPEADIEIVIDEPMEKQVEEAVQVKEEVKPTSIVVEGKILNVKNNEVVQGKVAFVPISSDGTEITDDAPNGIYSTSLKPGQYKVKATAKGFMTFEDELVVTEGNQSIVRNFELSPLDVGSTFRLNNVLFNRGTTELLELSYDELNKVVDLLKENPAVKIELSGHTDNQGASRLNMKLSQERVDTVKKYLVEKGIDENRIEGKGYGGSRPIASNSNEETRKLNRRVEFTIIQNQ